MVRLPPRTFEVIISGRETRSEIPDQSFEREKTTGEEMRFLSPSLLLLRPPVEVLSLLLSLSPLLPLLLKQPLNAVHTAPISEHASSCPERLALRCFRAWGPPSSAEPPRCR